MIAIASLTSFLIMLFMITASPLRVLSPAALLAGAWGFVYGLQALCAPDMYSSFLATSTVVTLTLSFCVGELMACGFTSRAGQLEGYKAMLSGSVRSDAKIAHRLSVTVLAFTLLGAVGVVEYAFAMGLFAAKDFADLLTIPGASRLAIFTGEITISMYSRIGFLLAYPGVVFALTYYYLYKWRWWLMLPIINVALLGVTQAGRAGIMMVLVQLSLTIYLKNLNVFRRSTITSVVKSAIVPGLLILSVFVGGEFLREGFSSTGAAAALRVIGSARGYLFGGLSAFSYWINNLYDPTSLSLGKYSFCSLYSALGLITRDSGIYQFYAPISRFGERSNVYTAYRSFIEDFSLFGACLFYVVTGILIASITRQMLRGKEALVSVVIPMLMWVALSPMFSATYFNSFLLSCVVPYLFVKRLVEGKRWKNSTLYPLILTTLVKPKSYSSRSNIKNGKPTNPLYGAS